MKIILTKLNDSFHTFEVHRPSIEVEGIKLHTRNYLIHDFIHYSVESIAGFDKGFYGLLSKGYSLSNLNDSSYSPKGSDLLKVEQIVGPLQSLYLKRINEDIYMENAQKAFPEIISKEFISQISDHMNRLVGEWKKIPYRDSMQLEWPYRKH